jgi:phage terminase small subunit
MPRKPTSRTTNLAVIQTPVPAGPQPPAHLGDVARELWQSVIKNYEFEDPASMTVLVEACSALDRAERCRQQISEDGEVVRSRTGMLRAHPLLQSELQSRALACRLLQRLGLDLEPIRSGPGRPGGTSVGISWKAVSGDD